MYDIASSHPIVTLLPHKSVYIPAVLAAPFDMTCHTCSYTCSPLSSDSCPWLSVIIHIHFASSCPCNVLTLTQLQVVEYMITTGSPGTTWLSTPARKSWVTVCVCMWVCGVCVGVWGLGVGAWGLGVGVYVRACVRHGYIKHVCPASKCLTIHKLWLWKRSLLSDSQRRMTFTWKPSSPPPPSFFFLYWKEKRFSERNGIEYMKKFCRTPNWIGWSHPNFIISFNLCDKNSLSFATWTFSF